MNIAIIGAGFTGLAAAYTLSKKGHTVTVFEKDSLPGGLAIGFHKKEWEWTLEKHYHHWFSNDEHILSLAKEIGHEVITKRPITSVLVDHEMFQLDSPVSLLLFPKLSITDRVRMAFALSLLRFNPNWQSLEQYKTSDFLPRVMGKKAYSLLWEPQLSNKFGNYKNDISLAWFWARVKKRTANLCYPKGGFLEFAINLEKVLTKQGVVFQYNSGITSLLEEQGKLTVHIEKNNGKKVYKNSFDKILVTLPGFAFSKIAHQLPQEYVQNLTSLKSLGAINLVLRLSKQFMSNNTYWLSVCDKTSPIMAIVEHTNYMDKKYYNNEHLVYLGNYLPQDHEYFRFSPEKLLSKFDPFLQTIHKNYDQHLIGVEMFTAPFAQPIIPVNYSKYIPEIKTPLKNIYLANMQQVYPWDRGTNYAVELGQKAADIMLSD